MFLENIVRSVDFTHLKYISLLTTLRQYGYKFYLYRECIQPDKLTAPHVILRHDVDRRPSFALALARLENQHNVVSTYFFRTKPLCLSPRIVKMVAGLGHDVGYHYEDFCDAKADHSLAWETFQRNLNKLSIPGGVKTIAMHGSILSPWNNLDLWNHYDYRRCGVLFEAFLDMDWDKYTYFTDTGRSWDQKFNLRDKLHCQSPNHSVVTTDDLICFLKTFKGNLVISTHPERWAGGYLSYLTSLCIDITANNIKQLLRIARN